MEIKLDNKIFVNIDDLITYINNDTAYTIDESLYNDLCDDTLNNLVVVKSINPENYQCCVEMVVLDEDSDYHRAVLELTVTNQYHQFNATVADQLIQVLMRHNASDTLRQAGIDAMPYNQHVHAANQYRDMSPINLNMTCEQCIEVINNNNPN